MFFALINHNFINKDINYQISIQCQFGKFCKKLSYFHNNSNDRKSIITAIINQKLKPFWVEIIFSEIKYSLII
jgi:hypothetical protein